MCNFITDADLNASCNLAVGLLLVSKELRNLKLNISGFLLEASGV